MAEEWDGAVLAPVSEINEQMLQYLRELALRAPLDGSADGVPRLIAALREQWCALETDAQQRLAACPCLLLDAGFAQPQRWDRIGSCGVMDVEDRSAYFKDAVGVAVVRRTLVLAWHLARANRVTARVLLGMSTAAAERIAACRLADLEALAQRAPAWITPRWEQQPLVWRQLIEAASRRQTLLLRQAQLRGLQLLARAAGQRGGTHG
ncbi:MAG TPA: hypothetical protein VGL28_10345 [Steroidobacteraceae bacterium]|jgi:hypothetical protein